jgi:uncharacterized membrane-anchored protein
MSFFDILLGARGDNPSDLGGIAIIAGIVLLVLVGGFVLYMLWGRFGRARHDARRRPHRRDRVGRTSEFR